MTTQTTTLVTLALLAGTVLSTHAQSMKDAVQAAVNEHPNVVAAARNADAVGYSKEQAKAGWRPTVDLVAGTGWEHSNNSTTRNRPARVNDVNGHRDLWRNEARLTVRQMLFDGFETTSEVREQAHREESARATTAETKELIALSALEAYLNVLRTRELVALGQHNYTMHTTYLSQISQRTEAGRGSQADVQQAEGRAALAKSNLIALEGEMRNAEADYLQVMGMMPQDLSKDAAPFDRLPANLEASIDRALANNPAIKSALADIKAAEEAVNVARSAHMPRFDLEGGISRNVNLDGTKGTNNDESVMLMMRHNFYRGGADTNRVNERHQRQSAAQAELEQTRRAVEENVMLAWSGLQTSQTRLEPLNMHVTSASQTRDAYQEQFNIGQRTLLDLLDSENELFSAQTNLINGKYAVDLAAYSVLAQEGELVNTMLGNQLALKK